MTTAIPATGHRVIDLRDARAPLAAAAPTVRMQGVDLHPLGLDEVLERIEKLVLGGEPASVVTANVDHLITLSQDARFRASYESSQLRLLDGGPVVALARQLGCEDAERTTGAELFPSLLPLARRRGWRVAVIGGKPATLAAVGARAAAELPGLRPMLIGPERGFEHDEAASADLVARLERYRPDLVLSCVGGPKSELWWHANARHLPTVFVHCGAAVDFYGGSQQRAPEWLQNANCEWLFRLSHEPRRLWRRYLVRGPRFFLLARRELRDARLGLAQRPVGLPRSRPASGQGRGVDRKSA